MVSERKYFGELARLKMPSDTITHDDVIEEEPEDMFDNDDGYDDNDDDLYEFQEEKIIIPSPKVSIDENDIPIIVNNEVEYTINKITLIKRNNLSFQYRMRGGEGDFVAVYF